mmetsp:Transcript_28032/g.34173  ORF Transcript_28032/g.34173 Transcript_28032/m.34173 type:complete len:185 (+) Transcript_28032:153-707(+)
MSLNRSACSLRPCLRYRPKATAQLQIQHQLCRYKHGSSSYKSSKKRFHVPEQFIKFKAIRSSGPGGQNVNKVSTCVEARFNIAAATESAILPQDARDRLMQQNPNRINKKGELVVQAQEERTQARNKVIAKDRIDHLVAHALVEPKERNQWTELGEVTKMKRKDLKQHRKVIKSNRKLSRGDWD